MKNGSNRDCNLPHLRFYTPSRASRPSRQARGRAGARGSRKRLRRAACADAQEPHTYAATLMHRTKICFGKTNPIPSFMFKTPHPPVRTLSAPSNQAPGDGDGICAESMAVEICADPWSPGWPYACTNFNVQKTSEGCVISAECSGKNQTLTFPGNITPYKPPVGDVGSNVDCWNRDEISSDGTVANVLWCQTSKMPEYPPTPVLCDVGSGPSSCKIPKGDWYKSCGYSSITDITLVQHLDDNTCTFKASCMDADGRAKAKSISYDSTKQLTCENYPGETLTCSELSLASNDL